jgi:hypothetical protein
MHAGKRIGGYQSQRHNELVTDRLYLTQRTIKRTSAIRDDIWGTWGEAALVSGAGVVEKIELARDCAVLDV